MEHESFSLATLKIGSETKSFLSNIRSHVGRVTHINQLEGLALARIFHTDSSRGAAQHDADKADEDFGTELYWTYCSSLNRSPTQSASGSRKPQQNRHEISGLDTFEGIPKTDQDLDFHLKGDFKKISFEILMRKIDQLRLTNLLLVKGLFEETLPALLPNMKKVILAHVDCDVEEATRYATSALEKQMDYGGYIAIDDAATPACIGVMNAVEDTLQKRRFHAEQSFPHFVYRVPQLL